MRLQWSYTGRDQGEEREIAELWNARQQALEAKLGGRQGEETPQLRLSVEHADGSPAWRARAALYLSAGVLVSEASEDQLPDVLDRLTEELSQQIDSQRDQPPAAEPPGPMGGRLASTLETFHQDGQSRLFALFLLPVLDALRPYAERELRIRRTNGELRSEQVNPSELLHEAVVRAWEEFPKRSQNRSLDGWLVQQLDAVLDEAGELAAGESLTDRRAGKSTDSSTEELKESLWHEWTKAHSEPELIRASDLFPNLPGAEAWDQLPTETKRTQLDQILAQFPRQQRQILMLHLMEGFGKAEIADIQQRAAEDVDEQLAAGTAIIRQALRDLEWRETEERLEKTELKTPRRSHRT